MKARFAVLVSALLFATPFVVAQQPTQPQMKVDSSNRTLTISATDNVTVEPDLAVLHIGFATQPTDAKSAYGSPKIVVVSHVAEVEVVDGARA